MRFERFVQYSISAAEQYLVSVYQGFWADFLLMPGSSNHWISAMVVTVTSPSTDDVLQAFRTDAFEYLSSYSELNSNRIGYNLITPPDGDSTIWLARAYASLGKCIPEELTFYINSHLSCCKLMASTYTLSDGIDKFIGVDSGHMAGWYGTHGCVTANYLSLIRDRIACNGSDVTEIMSNSFFLDSYWWPTDAYIVALCPHLLLEPAFKCGFLDSFVSSFRPPLLEYDPAQLLIKHLSTLFKVISTGCASQTEDEVSFLEGIEDIITTPGGHSWMILPMPHEVDRYSRDEWEYNGLLQGSAVSDQSGVFTICTILSLLYYIRDRRIA